jgi:NB-ARC domain
MADSTQAVAASTATASVVVVERVVKNSVAVDKLVPTVQIHHLPDSIAHFIGRERELKAIGRMVAQGTRVVEISDWQGRGGIGKSALAIQIAHDRSLKSPNFQPNIQLYANLHGEDSLPRDAKEVLQELLLLRFGVAPARLPQNLAALQRLFHQRLQGQQVLLVLDNAAHLKQIEPLLPPAALPTANRSAHPACLVLITSRKPVLTKEIGETLYLEGLAEANAIQLLRTMAGDDRIPPDGSALRQLLQLSGCLPLSLRMLGAFLRHKSECTPEMFVLHLQQERIKYKALSPQTIDLIAGLSLMYRTLHPDHQAFLKRLSVLRGDDFDLPIVSYLNGQQEPSQTRALLKSLIAQQWILRGVNGRDRFKLHDMVRLFIWEKVKPNDRQTLILRALAWQDQQVNAIDQLLMRKVG